MSDCLNIVLILTGGSFMIGEMLDGFACPRHMPRRVAMVPFRLLPVLLVCSVWLAVTGSSGCALVVAMALYAVIVTASNLKLRLLNEPLVFSDLALVSAFFRHPGFYLIAIPVWVRLLCMVCGVLLVLLLLEVSTLAVSPRLIGVGMFLVSSGLLAWLLERYSRPGGPPPDLWADVRRDGLVPSLLLYAARCWRLPGLAARPPLPHGGLAPESVMIIQCESYADPADLEAGWETLPALSAARAEACQWGRLQPGGLGAYTMRSEYGVLCGGRDADLSYRQFDPFLAARGMTSHALPHRLGKFYERALFVHPYDLRFYGRDQLVPLWGFTDIVGRERFSEDDKMGPYVSDAALTVCLLDYLQQHDRFLAYCVTIENHGPWKKGRLGKQDGAQSWHEHARNSDVMLATLLEAIKTSGRDVMLVFFGDHRPALKALPAVRGLERTTPYVILRPNDPAGNLPAMEPADLTPAGLHEAILNIVAGQV